jgi:hypothetical protein
VDAKVWFLFEMLQYISRIFNCLTEYQATGDRRLASGWFGFPDARRLMPDAFILLFNVIFHEYRCYIIFVG